MVPELPYSGCYSTQAPLLGALRHLDPTTGSNMGSQTKYYKYYGSWALIIGCYSSQTPLLGALRYPDPTIRSIIEPQPQY